jgi:hypothetical protein
MVSRLVNARKGADKSGIGYSRTGLKIANVRAVPLATYDEGRVLRLRKPPPSVVGTRSRGTSMSL